MKGFIFSSIFILILTGYTYSQGIFKMPGNLYAKATYANCDVNPVYVQNISCKLKVKTWEHNIAYIDADLILYVRNVTVRLESFKYTNQFRPFLINVTFNYCEIYRNGHAKNPYLQTVLNIVFKYSNLHHACPYYGHLYLHGGYVDFDLIPFYIPIGKYKLLLTFFNGWPVTWLGTVTYVFKIAEKKKYNQD